MRNADFVMPAWIAGRFARMLPETSMSAWIPALHAGRTQSRRAVLEVTEVAPPVIFEGAHEVHEGSNQKIFETFVSPSTLLRTCFAPFVVRVLLQKARATSN